MDIERKETGKAFTPDIIEPAEIKDEYFKLCQDDKVATTIMTLPGKDIKRIDPISDTGVYKSPYGVEVQMQPASKVEFTQVVGRLYLIITKKLTAICPYTKEITDEQLDKYSNITLTVKEYMDILGIKNRATAYQQLNSAVYALVHTTFLWDKTIKTKVKGRVKTKVTHYESPVLIETEVNKKGDNYSYIINGEVKCKLTPNIMRQLMQGGLIVLPNEIFKVNINSFPHFIPLCFKICKHYSMNAMKENSNATRLSIKSILNALPEIPDYETVKNSRGRRVKQLIIDPIEKTLDELHFRGVLREWHYCNPKGAPIRYEQCMKYTSDWINWIVEFTPTRTTDPDEIEAYKERVKARTTRKRKKPEQKQAEPKAQPVQEEGKISGGFSV